MVPARAASAPPAVRSRFAWIYIPNGVVQDAWHPRAAGRDWELTPSLEPLADLRRKVNVFTGLDRQFRGGTGVHAQAGCCWLTSSPPSEALDGGFPTNLTLDQIIAREIGRDTLLPSLELSCNDFTNQKETKYFETISWRGPGYAAGVQKNPRNVFRRLFGSPAKADRGVLDCHRRGCATSESTSGRGAIGGGSASSSTPCARSRSASRRPNRSARSARTALPQPPGIPEERGAYIRLMGDLMAVAFQLDLTRVATLVIDPERWDTPRMYHGVFDGPQNHHVLTHTKGDEAVEKLKKIDRFHVEQFAYLARRLDQISEGDGTLTGPVSSVLRFGNGRRESSRLRRPPRGHGGRRGWTYPNRQPPSVRRQGAPGQPLAQHPGPRRASSVSASRTAQGSCRG